MKPPVRRRSTAPIQFLVLNDLHLQVTPSASMATGYPGATARAEWLLAQCAKGGPLADIDFVLSAGDLIEGETLAAMDAELALLQSHLKKLTKPFYPCCGNHEIQEAEGDPKYEAPYVRAFGPKAFDYLIPAGAADLIVLNNAGSFHVTAARRKERHAALRQMLETRPKVPKILVCHIPLVAVRDEDALRASFGHVTYRSLEGELLDLLDSAGAAVRLVISGHQHLTGAVDRRGTRHCVVSGLASVPHDYAVVTVTSRAIAVEVRSVPGSLHDQTTNIHGRPSFPRDYTDAAHPTMSAYLRGNRGERKFTVPLAP